MTSLMGGLANFSPLQSNKHLHNFRSHKQTFHAAALYPRFESPSPDDSRVCGSITLCLALG